MGRMTVRAGWIGAMVAVSLLATGCAPEPGPSPSPSGSSSVSATPSAAPEVTPTPTVAPSPSATPAPTGPPATRPVEPPADPDSDEMTSDQAAALCAEEHRTGDLHRGDQQIGEPVVREREVTPRWYVQILAENENGEYYQECTIGGSSDDPEWGMIAGVVPSYVTDEYIQEILTTNGEA